jgi:LacI family transcriptional regulator
VGTRQRKSGWESALKEASIIVKDGMWSEGDWSPHSGEQEFRELLDKYPQMDGVFVGNDQMALGVLQFAHRAGIRIPQDLAVAGFDGIPESGFFWPPLTTVVQDQHELGCKAVGELVKMIKAYRDENEVLRRSLTLEIGIVIRESSQRITKE